MVKLCSFPEQRQPMRLRQGDYVRYVGADSKLYQDYANQDLRIIAIDVVSGIAICDNAIGQRLVGVTLRELQRAD